MSPANHTTFKSENDKYISTFGDKGSLPLPPGKHLAVGEWMFSSLLPRYLNICTVTCMDARIESAHLVLGVIIVYLTHFTVFTAN